MKECQRAHESGDAPQDQPACPVTGSADDQSDADAGQRHRQGEPPHAEQEPGAPIEPRADRPGEVEERQGDQDGEHDEHEPPDIVGLTAECGPDRVAHRSQHLREGLLRLLLRLFLL